MINPKGLNVGDVIEHGKLFPGIDQEDIVWELIDQTRDLNKFIISWFGIPLGRVEIDTSNNGVKVRQI